MGLRMKNFNIMGWVGGEGGGVTEKSHFQFF